VSQELEKLLRGDYLNFEPCGGLTQMANVVAEDEIGAPVYGCFKHQVVVRVRRNGPLTLGEWNGLGELFEFRDERFDFLRRALEGSELVRPKSYVAILAYEGVAEEQARVEPQNPDQRRSRSS
jgi:hypothetical protein